MQRRRRQGAGLTYISAVTVEEKSVWDYNQGNPTGDPATLGKRRKPPVPLVAVYPKEGTLLSDNPCVVLTAPWVDDAEARPPPTSWTTCRQPAQQKRFTDVGVPRRRGQARRRRSRRTTALLPDRSPGACSTRRRRAVLDQVARRPGSRCASGPGCCWCSTCRARWATRCRQRRQSKLELAKQAAIESLTQFAPDDEVGPVGVLDRPAARRRRTASWCRSGAGRRRTGRSSSRSIDGAGRRRRHRAVRDHPATRRRQMLAALRPGPDQRGRAADRRQERVPAGQRPRRPARRPRRREPGDVGAGVHRSRTATAADLGHPQRIAEASRAAAYDASDPASIDKVLTAVLSNF